MAKSKKIEEKKLTEGSPLEDVFNLLGQLAPGESDGDGTEMAGVLLAMDDDSFSEIAPIILEQTKKSFNDPETAIMFVSALNKDNVKYEDIVDSYDELISSIDELVEKGTLSAVKKDFLKEILTVVVNTISDTQLLSKRIIEIPIELMDEKAKIPAYANVGDAAADLYAIEDYEIMPGEQVMVKTGIKVAIPYGYGALIQPRSGLSSKSKLRICNTPGLIDSGYRGEICVLMENVDPPIRKISQDKDKTIEVEYGRPYKIEAGDRIAQLRLIETPTMSFAKVSHINEYKTTRGEGGFGSTGIK